MEAFDHNGTKFRFSADGILGRVIQHEQDHMEGIEFLEKTDPRQLMAKEHYLAQIRNRPDQVEAQRTTVKRREEVN